MPLWKNVARGRKKKHISYKVRKITFRHEDEELVLSMESLELMGVRSRTSKKGPGYLRRTELSKPCVGMAHFSSLQPTAN